MHKAFYCLTKFRFCTSARSNVVKTAVIVFSIFISLSFVLTSSAHAAINNTINFQSKIVVKSSGLNLTTGSPACVASGADTCDFRVRIWNHATNSTTTSGGNLMFQELFTDVEIGATNGIFNLNINSVCAATTSGNSQWGTSGTSATLCALVDDSDSDSDTGVSFDRNDLYIEITFDPSGAWSSLASPPGGIETFSRIQLKSVPSAFVAQSLSGIGATGFVQLTPSAAQTTTSTNSLINLESTATGATNTLVIINENGTGTPNLLDLQAASISKFLVSNAGNVTAGTYNTNTFTASALTFTGANPAISASTVNTGITLDANGSGTVSIGATSTGNVLLAGGSAATGCTVTNSTGDLTCTGTISGGATGTVGYWSRAGTTLSPATAGDNVTTTGNISTTSTGTITSAGLLTASNGFTQTTGAHTVTGTSGSITLTGFGATSITSTNTTTDAFALTAASLQTASALNVTSTNNTAANTSWAGSLFTANNNQATTSVSGANLITGLDVQFNQNTGASATTNNETAMRIAIKANGGSPTDATVASILRLENLDTATGNQITATDGLNIQGGNITNGINLSGTFGTNLITSTNFTVTQAGALTANSTVTGSTLILSNASPSITASSTNAGLTIDANGSGTVSIGATSTGNVLLAGGSAATGCTVTNSTGDLTCTGTISGGATGTVGYWSRAGTTLSPATAGDNITTTGAISTTSTGTITSAGLLTASNAFTQTTGAHTVTGTSGSITLTGFGSTSITSTNTTTDVLALTAASLQTGSILDVTSTNNTAANTSWSANLFTVNNNQATTSVSGANLITGIDVQFNQNTGASATANNETAMRIAIKSNTGSPTDSTVASLLRLENLDGATGNQITATDGINIQGSNITNGITVVGSATTTNGINLSGTFGTNLITSTNFTVTQAGALTANSTITGSTLVLSNATPSITASTTNAGLTIDANGSGTVSIGATSTGNVLLAGGSAATGCTVTNSTGDLTCTGTISGGVTGTVGYWTRAGTTLSPATAGDNITTTGAISTTSTGTITSAGLLTGSNGLTLTTGALNLTGTSGAITLSGFGTTSITSTNTTTNAVAITAASLQTGNALTVTSTNNTAANTAWAGSLFTANNNQATASVATGSIYGWDFQFLQNTGASATANTDNAMRIALKANAGTPTDTTVSSLLRLENLDTGTGNQITATDGINIQGANITNGLTIVGAATMTNGINLSGTFGTNLITSTNFTVTQAGAITAGTYNTNTFTASALTFAGATPAISASTAGTSLTIDANGAGTVSIGATSTGDVLLAGGSGATGCTVTNSNGNLTCTGAISGGATSGFVLFTPASAQTTTSTNSLINIVTTATSATNSLIIANENGTGTPNLLDLQVASASGFLIENSSQANIATLMSDPAQPYLILGRNNATGGTCNNGTFGCGFYLNEAISNFATSGGYYGIYTFITNSSTNTGNFVAGGHLEGNSAKNLTAVEGIAGVALVTNTTGAVTISSNARGGFLSVGTTGAGTKSITSAYGLVVSSSFAGGTATITNHFGIKLDNNSGGGFGSGFTAASVTNSYGLYYTAPTGAAALTNAYGIYLENQNAGATLNYGIYIAGAGTAAIHVASGKVYFGEQVGIGATATYPLDVQEAVTASGAVADGVRFLQTLTAGANGDTLNGLLINPTIANNAKTSVISKGINLTMTHDASDGSSLGISSTLTKTNASTSATNGAGLFTGVAGPNTGNTIAGMFGILGEADVGGSTAGTITDLTGVFGIVNSTATTSTVTKGKAIYGVVKSGTGITYTNSYGIYIDTPVLGGSGTSTTNFGAFIATQNATGVTNSYGIYIQGATTASLYVNSGNLIMNSGNITFNTSANTIDFASVTNGNTFNMKIPQKATTTVCANAGAEGLMIKDTGGTQRGHICIDGPTSATPNKLRFYAEQFNAANTDVAENYSDLNNNLGAGDVVSLEGNTPRAITKATSTNNSAVIGIISTDPGFTLSGIDDSNGGTNLINPKPVALSGRVPVKIDPNSDPIAIGDFLTASDTPGMAKKATASGYTIAKALETWNPGGASKIEVFVNLTYYNGSMANLSGSSVDLIQRVTALENSMISVKAITDSFNTAGSTTSTSNIFEVQNTLSAIKFTSASNTDLTMQIATSGKSFKIIDAGNTTLFSIDSNGKITIKQGANSSVGSATLPAGQTEVQISNTSVTDNSNINITPRELVLVRVKSVTPGVGFTLEVDKILSTDAVFDYLIIN